MRRWGPQYKGRNRPAESINEQRARQQADPNSWTESAKKEETATPEGGGDVISWLAQKTKAGQLSTGATVPTAQGAIEWFNAQKKKESPPPQSGAAVISALANLAPQVVTSGTQEAKPQGEPKPAQQQSAPFQIPLPASATKTQLTAYPPSPVKPNRPSTGNQTPNRKTPGGRDSNQRGGQSAERRGNRHHGQQQYQQQQQQPPQEEMTEEMAQKLKEQMESPEYQAWAAQQEALQHSQEALRRQLYDQLQAQDANAAAYTEQRLDVQNILELIDQHQIVFICTDTGSGKSTRVPKALVQASSAYRIVSTQPRRTATVSIANHVAGLLNTEVGDEVGYWIRGEKKGDERTRLWYMTSYTLLLYLLNNPLHPPFTHIILDEFHERQPDIEVTVALLKLCLKNSTANFKLIIMSATLRMDDWADYFEGLSVAVYKQSEPEHPIHDYFMEEIATMVGCVHRPVTFHPTMVDTLVHDNNIFIAQHLIMLLNAMSKPHHSLLVFLPGRGHVEQFTMWIQQALAGRAEAIPWHSAVELPVIQRAISRRNNSMQKIYLATDIAEVSITLPDVVFVVDLGLVKRPVLLPENPASVLYPPLMLQWISQGSVAQRRGRIGRVQQGFYFSLLSKTFIEQLSEYPPPPIANSRIDELGLHCLQLATNPVAVFSICRGQPSLQSIVSSMQCLLDHGCIIKCTEIWARTETIGEVFNNSVWSPAIMKEAAKLVDESATIEEYVTTFIGRLLQLIPVSIQQGMLVFYGFLTGLEALMILAAAVTNSLPPFIVQMQQDNNQQGGRRKGRAQPETIGRAMENTENSMKDFASGAQSDIIVIMRAVLTYRAKLATGDERAAAAWCAASRLSVDRLQAIVELDQHIKNELAGFVPFRDVEDPQVLLTQLEKFGYIVTIASCAAFASQALEVTNEGTQAFQAKEGAVGIFTDLKAMPDLHSPSVIRWNLGEIIIPVVVSLRYSHMLVSFSTAIRTHKEFYLALLLLGYRVQYGTFVDDNGPYSEFRVTFSGRSKYVEVSAEAGAAIVEFRRILSRLCASLRMRFSNKDIPEDVFDMQVLAPHGLPPFAMQQRDTVAALGQYFFGPSHDRLNLCEVQHGGEELDHESILAFAVPQMRF